MTGIMLTVLLATLTTIESAMIMTSSSAEEDLIMPFIFNGEVAKIEDHPYLVYLDIGLNLCGGAILDKNIVLTAAHCLDGIESPEDIEITAGATYRDRDELSKQVLGSTTYVIHPDYRHKKNEKMENDIALVRTSGNFKWTRHVQPRSIPTNWDYQEETKVTTAGWGKTEKNVTSQWLLKVDLLIATNCQCKDKFRNFLPETTFCVYSAGKDSCDGDSGNPIVNENGDIIGLVSYGKAKCGQQPSVNTKTTLYKSWVDTQLKSLTQESREEKLSLITRDPLALSRFFESTMISKDIVAEICGPTWKLWCKDTVCHCYSLLKSLLSWEEAAKQCGRYGGELASIHSSEENKFLGGYINSRYTRMWIGLNDIEKEGEYTWQKGEKPSYFTWNNKEPNNFGGDEDCVEMNWFMKWNDVGCSDKLNSLCKVPVSNYSSKCKRGWAFYKDQCYQIHTNRLTWVEARQNCEKSGAELASIFTADENEFIHILLNDIDDDNLWIGLTRRSTHSFRWLNSNPVPFTAWDPLWGQPNNYDGEENCVLIHKDSGKWHDYRCDTEFPSLCKMSSY